MTGLAAALLLLAAIGSAQTAVGPSSLKGQPAVVIFLSARCPVSNAYGERLQRIYNEYRTRGVRLLFFNSNVNETDAEIHKNSQEHGFSFPIVRDTGSLSADLFGAHATPEAFVLDRDGHIRYHGAIDDSINPARVHHQNLRQALDQVLAGVQVTGDVTRTLGCTIKRPR